jgi:hypothetical protein
LIVLAANTGVIDSAKMHAAIAANFNSFMIFPSSE